MIFSHHFRAELVDFHKATGHDGTHPKMFTWIHKYYNQEVGTRQSPPPPLFLQHQGKFNAVYIHKVGGCNCNDADICVLKKIQQFQLPARTCLPKI